MLPQANQVPLVRDRASRVIHHQWYNARMRTIKILVTGGGSSGHISPALAIIKTIGELAAGADWRPQFRYIGGTRGIEQEQVTAAGIEFVSIATGKLRRYFSLENLTDMFRIPVG